MPEALILQEREYGLRESAILSTGWIFPVSNPDVCAGTGAVFSAPQTTTSPSPQVSCELSDWLVRVKNATLPLPTWFVPCVEALLDLLSLPPGWNSHSAKEIEPRNATAAIKLLGDVLDSDMPAPKVVPRVNGNIQLEWHSEQIDIEVYIDSPSSVDFFAEDVSNDEVAEGPLAGREEELKNWLKRVALDLRQ